MKGPAHLHHFEVKPVITWKQESKAVVERDFFKSVSQTPRLGEGYVNNLAIEYFDRTSSSVMHNHKSQHGTRVQQR
jgi:hypothetical protein